jgi:rRNA-processing protein EBP2
MVKTKLKLKESLKNLKSTELANKAESSKKNKKVVAPVEQEELEGDNLALDTKKIISQINEENGSETLSHKEQRKLKKALKKQTSAADEDDEDAPELLDTNKLVESDSEDEENFSIKKVENEDEEEEEEEEDVPLSDVELDDDADVVPFQKVTVNNRKALAQALSNIALPYDKMKFSEHLSVSSDEPLVLKDVFDDLERELGFYKQGLAAANLARAKLVKEDYPFTRPTDYFAEMVKSDEHMDKLKQKLIETETSKKAAQDARRQRELKKFGKQVQHAKLQERAKEKRETLDKIKSLKRKRSGNEISNDDFDIAIEEAAAETSERRGGKGKPNARRQAKNAKYGSGGKKRFLRKNDAASSNDLSGFNNSKKKGVAKRPGKSKRAKTF